jgi:hypothetical protein
MLLRPFLASLGLVMFVGCTMPTASYRKVDQSSPAFKEAVAHETQVQQDKGLSAGEAEKTATQLVTKQVIKAEKERRLEQAAPLVRALTALEQPVGCWAYTVTSTKHQDGKTTVEVERYDPFQPENRLWTLVSRDGVPPDEPAQADYRKTKLRASKKSLFTFKPRSTASERVERATIFDDFECISSDSSRQTTFNFSQGKRKVPMLSSMDGFHHTYVVENATGTLSRQTAAMGAASLLGGTVKVDHFEAITDYALVALSLPPFVARTHVRFRGNFYGKDTGEIELEAVYTDFRKVKCYEDRFETRIGTPELQDFLPGRD